MNDIELTTMCAVVKDNKVLMINRVKSWNGWAFPGGHMEANESAEDCIKREMREEAGIGLKEIQLKGFANIFNNRTLKRHIIFNYVCSEFDGIVQERCEEGALGWFHIDEIEKLPLAEGMHYRLPLFFNDKCQELYIEWNEEEGYTKVNYQEA